MAAHIWFQLTTHFINPEKMKGWVGLVGWPIVDGLPTLVVTHQLQVERRTGKVRRSETDVLPLCHATNANLGQTEIIRTFQDGPCSQGRGRVRTEWMQSKFPVNVQCSTAYHDRWHGGRSLAWREDHSVPSHPSCTQPHNTHKHSDLKAIFLGQPFTIW